MNLQKIIVDKIKDELNSSNSWYTWKINEEKLPSGLILKPGTDFQKNLELKSLLCELYGSADKQKKFELTNYYISKWGGVNGNKRETVERYSFQNEEELIANGKKGVASWSKALCIRNPLAYPIFDARVSISLNALQNASKLKAKMLFPILNSKNVLITKFNSSAKQIAKKEGWKLLNSKEFYPIYVEILENVAVETKTDVPTIEMFLFAKSIDFGKQSFLTP